MVAPRAEHAFTDEQKSARRGVYTVLGLLVTVYVVRIAFLLLSLFRRAPTASQRAGTRAARPRPPTPRSPRPPTPRSPRPPTPPPLRTPQRTWTCYDKYQKSGTLQRQIQVSREALERRLEAERQAAASQPAAVKEKDVPAEITESKRKKWARRIPLKRSTRSDRRSASTLENNTMEASAQNDNA